MPKTDANNCKRCARAWGGRRAVCLLVALVAVMLSQGCNVVSDSQLKEGFERNRAEFVRLADMIGDDRSLQSVGFNASRPSDSDISQQRWAEY